MRGGSGGKLVAGDKTPLPHKARELALPAAPPFTAP